MSGSQQVVRLSRSFRIYQGDDGGSTDYKEQNPQELSGPGWSRYHDPPEQGICDLHHYQGLVQGSRVVRNITKQLKRVLAG